MEKIISFKRYICGYEEFDFSALRSYLQGQMDLGDSEVYLDEPWTPKKRVATPAAPAAATSRPAAFSAPDPSHQSSCPTRCLPPVPFPGLQVPSNRPLPSRTFTHKLTTKRFIQARPSTVMRALSIRRYCSCSRPLTSKSRQGISSKVP